MKITVQAMTAEMSREQILQMLPEAKRNQLKGKGRLQAYVVAHEGNSRPKNLATKVSEIMKWPRTTIQKIKEKIKEGTKFFINHGVDTNSHEGRKPVGEVLSHVVQEIKGKMSNVVVGYFPDETSVENMDVCSIEADVVTDAENNVNDIESVTGIALGSSDKDSPAFEGAHRLATIQCFDSDRESENNDPGDGGELMNFEEVKAFVRNNNVWPHQLFTEEQMKSDRVFGRVFEQRDSFKTENETLKNKAEEAEKTAEAEKLNSLKQSAKNRLADFLPEGITEKQKSFIDMRFDPEKINDLSDDGLKSFIDEAQSDFDKFAKVLGNNNGDDDGDDNSSSEDTAAGSAVDKALADIGVK